MSQMGSSSVMMFPAHIESSMGWQNCMSNPHSRLRSHSYHIEEHKSWP